MATNCSSSSSSKSGRICTGLTCEGLFLRWFDFDFGLPDIEEGRESDRDDDADAEDVRGGNVVNVAKRLKISNFYI